MSWYKKSQNDMIVDLAGKSVNIPTKNRRDINKSIHDLGSYHKQIPIDSIFDILKNNGVIPIQEDGTYWSGLLIGGKECGDEGTKDQVALIDLAIKIDEKYFPCKQKLSISWCVMPSGKYEIVCYLN